jgi:hypothetical protein
MEAGRLFSNPTNPKFKDEFYEAKIQESVAPKSSLSETIVSKIIVAKKSTPRLSFACAYSPHHFSFDEL